MIYVGQTVRVTAPRVNGIRVAIGASPSACFSGSVTPWNRWSAVEVLEGKMAADASEANRRHSSRCSCECIMSLIAPLLLLHDQELLVRCYGGASVAMCALIDDQL